MLYLVAGWTGLRAQELASLQPESFRLEGAEPTVTVQAGYSKHKREDILPLRSDLADLLGDWLRDKPCGERLWPGAWWNKAASLVQADLEAAKAAWVKAAPNAETRQQREESERFAYKDGKGRYFDFHSLRGQFISAMESAGVSLKSLQALARHSRVETTLKHYARVQLADVRSALDALPGLPGGNSPEILRATGTDGGNVLADCLAFSERFQGISVDSNGPEAVLKYEAETVETPMISRGFPANQGESEKEAPPGIEPGMADLQSAALPLGEGAAGRFAMLAAVPQRGNRSCRAPFSPL